MAIPARACTIMNWLSLRFLFFFVVPPKPVHLQSPLSAGKAQAYSPTTGRILPQQVNDTEKGWSPNQGCGASVSFDGQTRNCLCSPSPVRGGVSGAHMSPVRHTGGIPVLTSSPVSGTLGPGKRGRKSCSPLKEGSPAKSSPRNLRPLAEKLRTPSPVQGRVGSYSPARCSKSWLGLHRTPSSKMEGREKRAGKSLSVPDLIVYLDENRLDFFCFVFFYTLIT